jgi:hypothetical protein
MTDTDAEVAIAELEKAVRAAADAVDEEGKRHRIRLAELSAEHDVAKSRLKLALGGLDVGAVFRAKRILRVDGLYIDGKTDRGKVVDAAIGAVLEGGGQLFHNFFAAKSYDRWSGQFIVVPYGFVPSHGHIVFSIGLSDAARKCGAPLNKGEMDDCVYYLRMIESIQGAGA